MRYTLHRGGSNRAAPQSSRTILQRNLAKGNTQIDDADQGTESLRSLIAYEPAGTAPLSEGDTGPLPPPQPQRRRDTGPLPPPPTAPQGHRGAASVWSLVAGLTASHRAS